MAEISFDTTELRVNVKLLGPRLNRGISGVMLSQAPKVQDYARANAPWTDRTGNARQGLFATYSKSGDGHTITLAHSVPYGIWLEIKNAGRYAIIGPTIQAQTPLVMKALEGLLSRLGSTL